jgi:taurine dioxygenase
VGGICLYGIEIPPVGGETIFYDGSAALERLERLDPVLRARLEGVDAVHFDRFAGGRAVVSEQPQERRWPVVLHHPVTGRPILFVNEQTVKALCLDDAREGEALLARLLTAFDDPAVQYVHSWQKGDLVVWDNFSLQHSRRAFAAGQRRRLRRVQLA